MGRMHHFVSAMVSALAFSMPALGDEPREARLRATSQLEIEQSLGPIEALIRSGDLRTKAVEEDTVLAGRRHQRLAQFYKGVPVWGAEVVRQIDAGGGVRSIFGAYHSGVTLDVTPKLTRDGARAALQSAGVRPVGAVAPMLTILPHGGLVHPVRPADLDAYVRSGEIGDVEDLYANAFFCCGGSRPAPAIIQAWTAVGLVDFCF